MEVFLLVLIGAITGLLVRDIFSKCRMGILAFVCLGIIGAYACNYLFVSYGIQVGDLITTRMVSASVGAFALLMITRLMKIV